MLRLLFAPPPNVKEKQVNSDYQIIDILAQPCADGVTGTGVAV